MKLFIDDLRDAPDGWVTVRSYDEAVAHVLVHGMPEAISFDHDLGDAVPTGFDFAKWIVEGHLDGDRPLPENFCYTVHSANPPGRANIEGLLGNFLDHIRSERA